jgi:hypothetical protein
MSALVNAANDMVIAAIPTHTPTLAGGGEPRSPTRKSPSAGTKFQPPLPRAVFAPRTGPIFGGSCTVVAIAIP